MKLENVEWSLPQKARLFAPLAGEAAARRRRQEERGGALAEGMLLLSRRQLRHVDGGEATAISVLEPFRLQLSCWEAGASRVELNVVVRQGAAEIAFSVIVPAEALGEPRPPRRQSTAPHVKPEAFARLWPGLRYFAELHGEAPRLRLELGAVTASAARDDDVAAPDHVQIERDDEALRITIDDPDTFGRRLFVFSLSQWVLIPLTWCGSASMVTDPSYTSQMDRFGEFPLGSLVALGGLSWLGLSLVAWVVTALLFRHHTAWLEVRGGELRVGGRLRRTPQRAQLATHRVDQIYAARSRDFKRGVEHTLLATTREQEQVTLLAGLEAPEAFFVEEQLERFLGIQDRPVPAESPDKASYHTQEATP